MQSPQICLLGLMLSFSVLAQPVEPEVAFSDSFSIDTMDDIDMFSDIGDSELEPSEMEQQSATSWLETFLVAPSRFTLKHEISTKLKTPSGVVNNRSSIGVEYGKFVLDDFYLRLDSQIIGYWSNDHRAKAEHFATNTTAAFVQTSFDQTSIKLGIQTLIWGESDGGAITDVISPRNYSELSLINLEGSRLGQAMINVEQFSSFGDWSGFYIPDPAFNEYALAGTAYYVDPFAGQAEYQTDPANRNTGEYGMRWKRTFGKSDISVMLARLTDNDLALRQDGYSANGDLLMSKVAQRFTMSGFTFNYVTGNVLLKGEFAKKSAKAFSNTNYQILNKDVVDVAVSLEYSLGGPNSVSLEAVNSHVEQWQDQILAIPRNSSSLVLNGIYYFLNDNLSVNLMTIYTAPYTSFQYILYSAYQWSDNIIFNLDAHWQSVNDVRNGLYPNRGKEQLVFKIQYQF